MQKPLVIKRNDFITEIENLINNAELPMFIMEDVLGKVYQQVQALTQQELKMTQEAYYKALREEESKGDSEETQTDDSED